MFEKLTTNLTKSKTYTTKITQQLNLITSQIFQTKISITTLQQQIQKKHEQSEQISQRIKKQTEELSNNQYKKQKLQIRHRQYLRKYILQEQIYNKKIGYQEQLKNKIAGLQAEIKKQNFYDGQIQGVKRQLEEIDLKINRQVIGIQNLYGELMSKNKKVREKQDMLCVKKRNNIKKRQSLGLLEYEDKQNIMYGNKNCNMKNKGNTKLNNNTNTNQNINTAKQQSQIDYSQKLRQLQQKHKEQTQKIALQTSKILQMYEILQKLSNQNLQLKNQINKSNQIMQQAKLQKIYVMKIKDMGSAMRNFTNSDY